MPRTPLHVRLARKYGQTAVLYAALALSAPGEYALAQMAGWDSRFAWLMPAVMSLYAAIGASVAKAQKEAARVAVGTSKERDAQRRSRNATFGALLALLMATAAQVTEHVITATVFGPTLWVVVVVSAVPPLVAAHVLHIDPPAEEDDNEEHEAPAEAPQGPAVEPAEEPEEEEVLEPLEASYKPVLVTYAEAAEDLGLSVVTIRGAANGPTPRIRKFPGATPSSVLVDIRECHDVFNPSRRSVGV
ncbi:MULTISPECIES: hypothetical protein [unclassified Streptomyces]|uniref:hypothetical protein n=1 Tax=unclassified Streptomyces TaxID=2593676 RepID=UPI00037B6C34|nr:MULTISPECIES: hypothetical protein [unclassified Streptomyces]MYY03111.1 hypothetical protein [Streptomyces sp. SID4913]